MTYEIPVDGYEGRVQLQTVARRIARAVVHFLQVSACSALSSWHPSLTSPVPSYPRLTWFRSHGTESSCTTWRRSRQACGNPSSQPVEYLQMIDDVIMTHYARLRAKIRALLLSGRPRTLFVYYYSYYFVYYFSSPCTSLRLLHLTSSVL